MEKENHDNVQIKKRVREDDASCGSPDSKLQRLDSVPSDLDPDRAGSETQDDNSTELVDNGVDSGNSGMNSPEAKRIQDELFNVLDDSDDPVIQGLDSLIKSFEDEIFVPEPASTAQEEVPPLSGSSQQELGYLLEASDDELGLPPTFSGEKEDAAVAGSDAATAAGSAAASFGEIYGFEDQISGYDSFELELGRNSEDNNNNEGEGFVALGGLFNHSDENFVPADMSGYQWQAESLSAL